MRPQTKHDAALLHTPCCSPRLWTDTETGPGVCSHLNSLESSRHPGPGWQPVTQESVHKTFGLTHDLKWWNLRWLITCRPGSVFSYSFYSDNLQIIGSYDNGLCVWYLEFKSFNFSVKFVHHFSCYVKRCQYQINESHFTNHETFYKNYAQNQNGLIVENFC